MASTVRLPTVLGAIDHLGIAVADLDQAIQLWQGTFGLPLGHRERVEEQGVEAALLDVGDGHLELLSPLGGETPVGRFLDRRGPGLHHVAFRVEGIEGVLERLAQAGVALLDKEPRRGIRNSRVAFVDPRASGRVLVELVEPAEDH